jgi:predicted metal-dependent phosphotriesterase family hydrolase
MTVLGPVSADELGEVLPHEHVFIDPTVCYRREAGDGEIGHEPVEMAKLGSLRRDLCVSLVLVGATNRRRLWELPRSDRVQGLARREGARRFRSTW